MLKPTAFPHLATCLAALLAGQGQVRTEDLDSVKASIAELQSGQHHDGDLIAAIQAHTAEQDAAIEGEIEKTNAIEEGVNGLDDALGGGTTASTAGEGSTQGGTVNTTGDATVAEMVADADHEGEAQDDRTTQDPPAAEAAQAVDPAAETTADPAL